MSAEAAAEQAQPPEVPASVRAQILATEHWGLLASRSTTQSEVLTRIGVFLTLTSATLVSIALVGQASDFSTVFRIFTVVVLGILSIVGILTAIRVYNVAFEDLMYVLAMNRLRAGYAAIDPGVEKYFMASSHDDRAGSVQTYFWLGRRSSFGQVAGSSMVFISAVTAALLGLFAATLVGLAAPSPAVLYTVGTLVGVAYFITTIVWGGRGYRDVWRTHTPLSPSPEDQAGAPPEGHRG